MAKIRNHFVSQMVTPTCRGRSQTTSKTRHKASPSWCGFFLALNIFSEYHHSQIQLLLLQENQMAVITNKGLERRYFCVGMEKKGFSRMVRTVLEFKLQLKKKWSEFQEECSSNGAVGVETAQLDDFH